MLAKVYSAAVLGVEAFEVEIEVNAALGGDPRMVIVGLPDAAVKESRDRVTTAISNSGYASPKCRTTINLAPADVKKEGPSFDLPIALGLVALGERGLWARMDDCCLVGELALTGEVRAVKGVLPVALEARRRGRECVVVPQANVREASMVEGVSVYGVASLREAVEFLAGRQVLEARREDMGGFLEGWRRADCDFAEVRGQQQVRRAVEVAVSGGHNLLLLGAPGSGKSMIARRIPTIIPPMSLEEAIETTKIHSICGLLSEGGQSFVAARPFRAPHHTVSDAGLLGGSSMPSPGEVSLAHNGVLFLDELPEFRRSTLEVLRQPLEDGRVTITRAAGTMSFPAEFMLVAAMNPCPCGNYGSSQRECRCTAQQVARYRDKISGPLLDRIDLHLEVPAVPYREMASPEAGEDSGSIRGRVMAARALQSARFDGERGVRCNARMTPRLLRRHCGMESGAQALLEAAMNQLHFSARAHDRILKVARTIADLAGVERIGPAHVAEAVQYRSLDRRIWG